VSRKTTKAKSAAGSNQWKEDISRPRSPAKETAREDFSQATRPNKRLFKRITLVAASPIRYPYQECLTTDVRQASRRQHRNVPLGFPADRQCRLRA